MISNPGDGILWWRRPGRRTAFPWHDAPPARGTMVLKSTYKGDMNVNFSSIVVDEINLVGSAVAPSSPRCD